MMDRHRTDFVELLFGLLFVATGVGFVVHQTTDRTFDAAWIAAIAFVTVGVAFLSVTLFNRPRSEVAGAVAGAVPAPVAEPALDVTHETTAVTDADSDPAPE